MAIRIAPTTLGMVLTSDIFLGVLAVSIGMPCRAMVEHMLAINADVEGLVADTLMLAHAGGMVVE